MDPQYVENRDMPNIATVSDTSHVPPNDVGNYSAPATLCMLVARTAKHMRPKLLAKFTAAAFGSKCCRSHVVPKRSA